MQHKFRDHEVNPNTKILLVGTFHPDIRSQSIFFYSTKDNWLWKILPACFNEPDLRGSPLASKKEFMRKHQIDFLDIIASAQLGGAGQTRHFGDKFIDGQVKEWMNVEEVIDCLKAIEAVYFTRKTFNKVPNIENRVAGLRNYCMQRNIRFSLIETPMRSCSMKKIVNWRRTMIDKVICR